MPAKKSSASVEEPSAKAGKPSANAEKPSASFEDSLNALEALVNKMEQGDLSLEESLKAFETGIQLTRDCQTRLTAAEQQVQQLMEQQGGDGLQNFEAPENGGE